MNEHVKPPPYGPFHWRYSCQGGPDSFQVRDRLAGHALVADGLSFADAHALAARLEVERPRCGLKEPVCWYCPGEALEVGSQDPETLPPLGEGRDEARCPRCSRWWLVADVTPCPWPAAEEVEAPDGQGGGVCRGHALLHAASRTGQPRSRVGSRLTPAELPGSRPLPSGGGPASRSGRAPGLP